MALAEPLPEAPPTAADVAGGPYKFLDYYDDTPEDRRRFAGREREVRELGVRIANEATLVLYGRSGLGKTSLLLAGVFPELRERGYRPVYVRTLTAPLDDLERAIAREYGWGEPTPGESLRELVARAAAVQPLVVVLDQFEEFFIRFRDKPESRAAFIAAVAEVVLDEALDAPVVFSLREDHLAKLDDFRELLPDLFANEYRLRPLTAFGVRQAILRPLLDRGIGYEDAVVSKLVDQIEGFGFDPPVLQILCSELYKEAEGRARKEAELRGDAEATPRITLADLDRVGGLEGIFRRYLDGVTRAIPEDQHLLARIVLDALITRDDTKQAATLGDLLDARFSAEAKPVEAILETLAKRRLVRRELRDGEWWYELIHELLVPIVKEWLDLDRRFLDFRQARTYVRNNSESELWRRNPEILLNAGILTDLLAPYRETFRFTKRELEFVLRSAVYRRVDDVKAWAERFGRKETVAAIEELARSARDGERLGAAMAAARVEEVAGRLADLCLRLVLDDPNEAVRRAAGKSLGKLARPEDLAALDRARRTRATRGRAREALADLRLGGHRLQGFSWLQRQMARQRAERRLVAEQKDKIRARRGTGLLSGLLGGMAWVATVGFVLFALLVALEGDMVDYAEWLGVSAGVTSILLPVGALLGLLLGWSAASAAARDAAIHGEGRWVRAVGRSRGLFYGSVALALIVFLVVAFNSASVQSDFLRLLGMTLVAAVLAAPLLMTWIALLAKPAREGAWPGVPQRGVWLWALLGSAGVPLSAAFAVAAMCWAAFPLSRDNELFLLSLCMFVLVTSFGSCVVTLAIARSAGRYPIAAPPPVSMRRRRWHRAATLAAVLLLVAGFERLFGPDALPLFATEQHWDVEHGLTHSTALRAGLLDTHYFRLHNRSGNPQFALVESSEGSVRIGEATVISKGDVLLIPPGRHPASLSSSISEKSGHQQVHLRLKPLAREVDGTPIVLSPGEQQVLAPVLKAVPKSRGGWTLALSGTMEGRQAGEVYTVLATAYFEAAQGPSEESPYIMSPSLTSSLEVNAVSPQRVHTLESSQLFVEESASGSWSVETVVQALDSKGKPAANLRTPPSVFVSLSLESLGPPPSLETYEYFSQEPTPEEAAGSEAPAEPNPEAP